MKERSVSPSMVVVPASSFVRVYVTTFEIALRLTKRDVSKIYICRVVSTVRLSNGGLHDSLCSIFAIIVLKGEYSGKTRV